MKRISWGDLVRCFRNGLAVGRRSADARWVNVGVVMNARSFEAEYVRLLHAIQTGVAYEIEHGADGTEPKHLRTGLNGVMSDHGSLAHLLMVKGVFTESEYFEAVLAGLQREKAAYERRLAEKYGTAITLG